MPSQTAVYEYLNAVPPEFRPIVSDDDESFVIDLPGETHLVVTSEGHASEVLSEINGVQQDFGIIDPADLPKLLAELVKP